MNIKNNINRNRDISEYIKDFGDEIKIGVDAILKASRIYAEAIRIYSSSAEKKFHSAFPSVTLATWDKFRAIGNGDLNPNAMLVSDVFCKAISKLPIHKQNRIFVGSGFKVVDPKTKKTSFVRFSDLTAKQERIVFDGNCVRTPEEQIKFIEDSAQEFINKKAIPYHIEGERLCIHRKCDIGKNELLNILKEMQ